MGEGVAGGAQGVGLLPSLVMLRNLVYVPLRDAEQSFVEPWFVDAMLNEAYLDLNARLRINKKVATGTTSSTGTIAIPTDLVEHQNLFVEETPVQIVDDDLYKSYERTGNTAYGQADAAVVLARLNYFSSVIETWPQVVSSAYVWEYVARPGEMEAESDTPAKLTKELCPRLVSYARAHAKWQEGEEAEGSKYMALYEQGLPGAPREAFRRNPAPMALIPEPGPFG
jgi:hypothetical protein